MRLNKWLGWVSAASPYALPPGAAVRQNNCMSLIPGQLTVRGGSKVIAQSSDRATTLWGYSIGSGTTDKVLGFTESGKFVEFSGIGNAEASAKSYATELLADRPVAFSQGRRGEVYVYQGYGKRGMVRGVDGTYRPVGLEPPDSGPDITKSSKSASYLARIDILKPGNGYHAAPSILIEGPESATTSSLTLAPNPSPTITPIGGVRQAKAVARIASGQVSEIEITDGGSGYTKTPWIEFAAPTGQTITGSGAKAKLELEAGYAQGDPETGVVYWKITKIPHLFWLCLSKLKREGNGFVLNAKSKSGKGSGAKAIMFLPSFLIGTASSADIWDAIYCYDPESDGSELTDLANQITVQVYDFGSGYDPDDEIIVEIPTAGAWGSSVGPGGASSGPICSSQGPCNLQATGYTFNTPGCPDRLTVIAENPYKRRKLKTTIANGGSGYLLPPQFVTDGGDIIDTEISREGKVTKLILENPSKTYLWAPTLVDESGNIGKAYALAIMRPIFRGKYQCYYRYVDETVSKEQGGPIYSNLSPATEVDCGDGCAAITWAYEPGPGTAVELWRTTADQSTAVFLVARIGGKNPFGSNYDTLSDYDLPNPDRANFEWMPIVTPDGRLNANRFGVASPDFAVGVVYQDRTWLGVDTTGKRPNTLMYSEPDEPEAMPDVNELILQTNLRDTDYITALIPYAGALIVSQSRHCHRISFVNSPDIDATTSLIAYRGCVNQRCWDIYQGIAYMLDDLGLYSLDAQGNVEHLSTQLDSLFRMNPDPDLQTIDFSKREWFFVRSDRNLGVIRIHVSYTGDTGKYPTRQIVYDPDSKSFWVEKYPATFSAAAEVRDDTGSLTTIHSGDKGLYQFGVGLTDDGTPIDFVWKSGNFEFVTDRVKGGGQQNPRNVSVVYKPTDESTILNLEVFYNGSVTPRSNVVGRDRGIGFVHEEDSPIAHVDMKIQPSQEAESHGIARALFAGKTFEDMAGSDTHVAIRLHGKQTDAGNVVIHSLDLQGVSEPGGE